MLVLLRETIDLFLTQSKVLFLPCKRTYVFVETLRILPSVFKTKFSVELIVYKLYGMLIDDFFVKLGYLSLLPL